MLIDNVVIDKNYQGKNLVGKLTEALENQMRKRQIKYFEIKASIQNGYAKKIEKVYKYRIMSGPTRTDQEKDQLWEARMHFKIKL